MAQILHPDYTKNIPDEILLEVLKFVPNEDIMEATTTCKRYLQVGRKLRDERIYQAWRKKTVQCWDIPEKLVPNTDDGNSIIPKEGREKALKYLIDQNSNIKRGDLIRFSSKIGYRNEGIAIYNGKEIIELEGEFDDYGHLPIEFKAIDEFPIKYFHTLQTKRTYVHITHNNIIWFDHKPYLEEILKNLTIGKFPDTSPEVDFVFTYFIHKNGRKYYIVAGGDNYVEVQRIWSGDRFIPKFGLKKNAKQKVIDTLSSDDIVFFESSLDEAYLSLEYPDLDILYLSQGEWDDLPSLN